MVLVGTNGVKPTRRQTNKPVLDETYFVMRGGFKMPAARNSAIDPLSPATPQNRLLSNTDIENQPPESAKIPRDH